MNIISSLLHFLLSRSRKIYITTTEPTDADGANGDIWLVYDETEGE